MKIEAKKIKELRDKTGVSIMKCKEALEATDGDLEKAVEELRKKGEKTAQKKADRETKEGVIGSYVHNNGKLAAMVKLYCETDFVARNQDFIALAKDLAMQVAATNPLYINPSEFPEATIENEKQIEREALKKEGKPDEIIEKILKGKIKKFKEENSLLKQAFIKNPEIIIEDLINDSISKLGENIKIEEIKRFEV
ncbi:MAG: elongation factor Ts [Candidatus Moranbacteria bacterium]|nr:elongation factor Ts [Candidatus Moranbacteria bacterium]